MATYRTIPVRALSEAELTQLSRDMKLSLSTEDMLVVQQIFREIDREPTDVELEVIAQTWSEHCKHRIFAATIEHTVDGKTEEIRSMYKTFIKSPTKEIMARKPGFVLSCFVDNAGFITLDDKLSVCLKAETHNHPSAIEPYAGANTGLGGVIRDILGAGKGAKPIANLDVFCFGAPDTPAEMVEGHNIIHPLGIMRGVVHGVRDYGNRMGIPTVSGAIQFDPTYIYNPLVYCGTAGVIPQSDIAKEMSPGLAVVVIGGRTGKDGLHGATFSSAAMGEASATEDQQAVQIGNPIEEKKTLDVILEARERGLIEFVTDCGAGGFSSAAGEMLSETGGNLYLERAPLKETHMQSWQIFLSESQERMVLAVKPENLPELQKLADTFQTEMTVLGESNDSGVLRVWHNGELVCELDNSKLHDAPTKQLRSVFGSVPTGTGYATDDSDLTGDLKQLFRDFAIVSREPIIREYDHEVQGNTVLKPLAGATADAPQASTSTAATSSCRWRWPSCPSGAKPTPTPWARARWTRRCASWCWPAPTPTRLPCWTTSAWATPSAPPSWDALWNAPRASARRRSPTARPTSPARTPSTTTSRQRRAPSTSPSPSSAPASAWWRLPSMCAVPRCAATTACSSSWATRRTSSAAASTPA